MIYRLLILAVVMVLVCGAGRRGRFMAQQQPVAGTVFFEPNADGTTTQWTKSSGTTAWNLIDDGTRQPTTPDTADNTSEVTDTEAQDIQFASGTYVAGTYTLWVYGKGGNKRKMTYAVDTGSGFGSATDLFAAGEVAGWKSAVVTISNQSQLDAFQVRFTCVSTAGGGGANEVFVYAAYLERT